MLLVLCPLALLGHDELSSFICTVHQGPSFAKLANAPINSQVNVCGYLESCVSERVAPDNHYWEMCLLKDPRDATSTVLLYTLDLTASETIPYEWFTLYQYDKGTLIIRGAQLARQMNSEDCDISAYCKSSNSPLAQLYGNE